MILSVVLKLQFFMQDLFNAFCFELDNFLSLHGSKPLSEKVQSDLFMLSLQHHEPSPE
jgi:hypothetical protein